MDRLQVAIEKAREQRAEALKAGSPTGPLVPMGTYPEPARQTAVQVPENADTDELWRQLAPLDMSARQLRDNRLLSNRGGQHGVPFDLLRTRMLHLARQNNWRYIGIVSPTPECGKTTAAANLAFAFSRQPEMRLMLLDLDLRRPLLAKMMGQKVRHSMEDVLLGHVDFGEHALRLGDNVAIGFNSRSAEFSSELLQSARTEERVAQLEQLYDPDLVLIDLPPLLSTDDNFGFLSKVDAVLLMVAAEQSTMDQIEVALRQLEDLTTVMGVVLNKCRHTGGAYGYDSKYYYS